MSRAKAEQAPAAWALAMFERKPRARALPAPPVEPANLGPLADPSDDVREELLAALARVGELERDLAAALALAEEAEQGKARALLLARLWRALAHVVARHR